MGGRKGWGERTEERKIRRTNQASSFLFPGPSCLPSTVRRQTGAMSRGTARPSRPENAHSLVGMCLLPAAHQRWEAPPLEPFLPLPFLVILPPISFLCPFSLKPFLSSLFPLLYFLRALLSLLPLSASTLSILSVL